MIKVALKGHYYALISTEFVTLLAPFKTYVCKFGIQHFV